MRKAKKKGPRLKPLYTVYRYVCMYVCMDLYTCTYIYEFVHMCLNMYVFVHMYLPVYMFTRIYVCMHLCNYKMAYPC